MRCLVGYGDVGRGRRNLARGQANVARSASFQPVPPSPWSFRDGGDGLSDHPPGTGGWFVRPPPPGRGDGLSDHPLPEDAAAHPPIPGMGCNHRKLTWGWAAGQGNLIRLGVTIILIPTTSTKGKVLYRRALQ